MEDLKGKTVLVIGGGARLGRAVSLACGIAGMRVAVHYNRSRNDAQAAVDALGESGSTVQMCFADLTDSRQADRLIEETATNLSFPDYLVCCQSGYSETTLMTMSAADLAAETGLTFTSHLHLLRAWSRMGGKGAAVHLLDARATDYDKEHVAYHLTKRMLASAVRLSAVELAPKIRINGISPGLVLPHEGADPTFLDRAADATLLRRIGTPRALTDAVLFLLESDFITGQILTVDGGRHFRGNVY